MNEEIVTLKDMIAIYNDLTRCGIALYGAGKRGREAIKSLQREGIRIICVADQKIDMDIGEFNTISLDDLKQRDDVKYCMITPLTELPDIEKKLADYILVKYGFINWLNHFFPRRITMDQVGSCRPFNHYESPYVCEYDQLITGISDIDMNEKSQIDNLQWIGYGARQYNTLIQKGESVRYKRNPMFSGLDALVLYSFINKYSPKKIIEVGSGYSTAIMLDAYSTLNISADITCIEPNPSRLKSLLCESDNVKIIEQGVQSVPLDMYDTLEENDLLFIDSSHVARRGSDVPFEYFQILPRIKKGVLIHIHDIHFPFEYCSKWAKQMRAYNEIYILRAFLINNHSS